MLKTAGCSFTIVSRNSFTASLFIAKHQVDPLMKVLRHVLTLQSCPVLLKEIAGICSRDRRDTGNMKQHTLKALYIMLSGVGMGAKGGFRT